MKADSPETQVKQLEEENVEIEKYSESFNRSEISGRQSDQNQKAGTNFVTGRKPGGTLSVAGGKEKEAEFPQVF